MLRNPSKSKKIVPESVSREMKNGKPKEKGDAIQYGKVGIKKEITEPCYSFSIYNIEFNRKYTFFDCHNGNVGVSINDARGWYYIFKDESILSIDRDKHPSNYVNKFNKRCCRWYREHIKKQHPVGTI